MTPPPPNARTLRPLLRAAAITVLTLALLAAALLLANFAPGWFSIALLLIVPLTVGLPTTIAVLACVSVWNGPPMWLFGLACAAGGLLLQLAAIALLQRLRRRRGAGA